MHVLIEEMEKGMNDNITLPEDDLDFADAAPMERNAREPENVFDRAERGEYIENCSKCKGSGRWVSFSGSYSGTCFACKGKGNKTFRTSPEARMKARECAAKRRVREEAEKAKKAAAYLEANPDIAEWLKLNSGRNEFADSMLDKLNRYGSLTENMHNALKRAAEKLTAAREKRDAAPGSGLNLSGIPSGMYAVPGRDTRLKVRIDNVEIGKWAGWVFVKDGAEYGSGTRYGSQKPGSTYRGKITEELKVIAADPFEASKAYGKLVGRCGVCGRKLEDANSVAAGIGPICAGKF